MKRALTNILVTGGAGFIGSNFIRYILNENSFKGRIVNVDVITYAGNLENLSDIEEKFGCSNSQKSNPRYFLEKEDICDGKALERILQQYEIDTVINFAAETHVDRSILGPHAFINTNVFGVYTLLEAAREYWRKKDGEIRKDVLFHHVSTDEVYGSLGDTGCFVETTAYDPRSPYSASKAASDHFVSAYYHTYGLPVTISNCSNNYGPYQFPEKFIPLMITNILENKPLPVYGDGKNIRDWIHVTDHNCAVWNILKDGNPGEKYNIGGETELENIVLLEKIIKIVVAETGKDISEIRKNIVYVKDRPGHDRRYSIDCDKMKRELNWEPKVSIEEGLRQTVRWYLSHPEWIASIKDGEYTKWYDKNYTRRTKECI